MSISLEEVRTLPMSTRLVPMWDAAQPDIFGVMLQFPNGNNKVWQLKAPPLPITEEWVAAAVRTLMERIAADLMMGASEPAVAKDPEAYGMTNWASVVGALHRLVHDWKNWRIEHYRSISRPASDFKEPDE